MSDEDEIMYPSSVRMPAELKAKVERHAKAANRSFSREVVFVLQQFYANEPEPRKPKKS